jgi:TolB-like protein/Tfp pilus assembly protein PilF
MKRCPECRRDYYDDTLLYCLDDGAGLLDGPASMDEPQTAILHETAPPLEAPTRAQIHTTAQTAVLPSGITEVPKTKGFDKRLILAPVALAVIVLVGFFGYRYFNATGTTQINSIAVMPFENRNSDADTDYLSDGLAESVIFRLTQIPDLRVSPTSSVMRYKGKETDIGKIASELGVDAVMTGRLSKRGDNLNITVELVDARTNKSLWGEQYERKLSELLTTQREIVAEIVGKLQLKLSGESEKKLSKKYTDNNEAYQLYLKGQFYFANRTNDGVLRSIEAYNQAIALDPNFALAYVGLANSYAIMSSYGYAPANENFPKTGAAIQRALAIDPDLAEAHAAHGRLLADYESNWAEAEREFKRSIELNPNVASTHYQFGLFFTPLGRFDEAEQELKRALELEPLAVATQANLAGVYVFARRNDLAVEQALKAFKLESGHPTARFWLGFAYLASRRYTDAIAVCESTLATDPSNQDCLQVTGYAYAKLGRRQETEAVIRKFDEIAVKHYSKAYVPAVMYALLGDKDRAFATLERSLAAHDWDIKMIKVDPFVDSLRGDPRFKDLLKRMNLPE